jgi:hypothetical protein
VISCRRQPSISDLRRLISVFEKLLTFAPGIHQHAEIRSDQKGKIQKRGVIGRGRHNWKGRENYELIRRSESSDRRGDELRLVDHGRHGPGLANAKLLAREEFRSSSISRRLVFRETFDYPLA